MLRVKKLVFNPFEENTYIVADEQGNCVVIDPGCCNDFESTALLEALEGLSPKAILLTHAHADHIAGIGFLAAHYDLPVYMHPLDRQTLQHKGVSYIPDGLISEFSTTDLRDEQVLVLNSTLSEVSAEAAESTTIKVIHTPGHSQGSVCFFFENEGLLFSGDTLFRGTIGRSDLWGGDYDSLIKSIMDKIMALDSDVQVFPGHGPSTNLGHERTHNPFLEPWGDAEEPFDPNADPIALSGTQES